MRSFCFMQSAIQCSASNFRRERLYTSFRGVFTSERTWNRRRFDGPFLLAGFSPQKHAGNALRSHSNRASSWRKAQPRGKAESAEKAERRGNSAVLPPRELELAEGLSWFWLLPSDANPTKLVPGTALRQGAERHSDIDRMISG